MTSTELLMSRAIDLARNGVGSVSPNPLVGCVIVKDSTVIGEGWHERYGEAHAEVNAVNAVKDKTHLEGSTVIVNLEPCSHHGKTPPCADLLIQHRVGKVVIANVDSNPLVSGTGIRRLRDAGIEVVSGVMDREGRDLNRRFFTMMEKKRPYVILKWAQTSNGFIAGGPTDPRWISNTISRQLVHKWRSEEDSVLVGHRTALTDNPRLNVRDWSGRNPVRLVIDKDLSLPPSLHLFDRMQKTIVFNLEKDAESENLAFVKLEKSDFLASMMDALYSQGIQSVIIEGGRATLNMFIQSGVWDEARVFQSSHQFKAGVTAPPLEGGVRSKSTIGSDALMTIQNLRV